MVVFSLALGFLIFGGLSEAALYKFWEDAIDKVFTNITRSRS